MCRLPRRTCSHPLLPADLRASNRSHHLYNPKSHPSWTEKASDVNQKSLLAMMQRNGPVPHLARAAQIRQGMMRSFLGWSTHAVDSLMEIPARPRRPCGLSRTENSLCSVDDYLPWLCSAAASPCGENLALWAREVGPDTSPRLLPACSLRPPSPQQRRPS